MTAGGAGASEACAGAGDRSPAAAGLGVGLAGACSASSCSASWPRRAATTGSASPLGLERQGGQAQRPPAGPHAGRDGHGGARPGADDAQRPHRGRRHRRRGAWWRARCGPRCSGWARAGAPARHQRRRQRRGRQPLPPDRRLPDRPPGGVVRRGAHQRGRLRLRLAVPAGGRHSTSTGRRTRWRPPSATATSSRSPAPTAGETVTVVFRTPFADWASLFDDLLPAHIAEQVGWNHGFDQLSPAVFVSGGPCEVVSWQPGSEIVLGRNPRWWGSPPSLDRIVVRAVTGDGALTSALGQGGCPGGLPGRVRPVVHGPGLVLVGAADPGRTWGRRMLQLEFNVRHAPLNAAAVRQGIAHAIDRAGIVETVSVSPRTIRCGRTTTTSSPTASRATSTTLLATRRPTPCLSARLLEQSGFTIDARGAWIVARQAGDASTSCGRQTTRGRRRWGPSWPHSSWRRASTSPPRRCRVRSCTGRRCPAAPSTSPSSPWSRAPIPVRLGNVFSTSPAITGAAVPADWSGFDDPKIDALFTQAVARAGTTAGPCHLPADRPGPVDRHAHVAAVRRADDARVVVVARREWATIPGASDRCGTCGCGRGDRRRPRSVQQHRRGARAPVGLALRCSMRCGGHSLVGVAE